MTDRSLRFAGALLIAGIVAVALEVAAVAVLTVVAVRRHAT